MGLLDKIGGVVTGAVTGGAVGGPIGAVLGGVAGLAGGAGADAQKEGLSKAAGEQIQAAREAQQLQEPFRQAGLGAMLQMQELLGLVPAGTSQAALAEKQQTQQAGDLQQLRSDEQRVKIAELIAQGASNYDIRRAIATDLLGENIESRSVRRGILGSGETDYAVELDRKISQARRDIEQTGLVKDVQAGITSSQQVQQQISAAEDFARQQAGAPAAPTVDTRRQSVLFGGGAQPAAAPAAASGAAPTATSPLELLQQTPGFQFSLQESERAIERAAARRGQRLSGNVLEELQRSAQGVAQGTFQQQIANLMGLTGIGQSAASGQAAPVMAIGSAASGRELGQAQVTQQQLGGISGALGQIAGSPKAVEGIRGAIAGLF